LPNPTTNPLLTKANKYYIKTTFRFITYRTNSKRVLLSVQQPWPDECMATFQYTFLF